MKSTTTDDLEPGARTAFWSELVAACQPRLDCRYPGAAFDGTTICQRTGSYRLVEYWSGEVGYVQTAARARRDADEDYRFVLPLAGERRMRQDGRQRRFAPGTAILMTLTAPFELVEGPAAHGLMLTIPARELDRPSPLAAGLDLTTGLGRVARDMLTGLAGERDHLTAAGFDAVCDRIVELLRMLLAGDDRPDGPGHLAEVEAMVRRYARAHAADPDLTGAAMAQALGWSLRQVQLALQRAGTTPRELIREERLRLARERLLSPAHRHLPITDVAHAAGFSSASALSAAFRQRYGMSPRDLRATPGR
ncbi:AraC family transcriptional regulator [Actinomadura craniellae]|uniref:AraC family transcriptional regulator n=1 Tax=Actinomadura craniellae TaxID=2231787 RepID=A0A365HA31_9ACTN|nr:AraC family transcriptional regulator [Actinomadura craniellae]